MSFFCRRWRLKVWSFAPPAGASYYRAYLIGSSTKSRSAYPTNSLRISINTRVTRAVRILLVRAVRERYESGTSPQPALDKPPALADQHLSVMPCLLSILNIAYLQHGGSHSMAIDFSVLTAHLRGSWRMQYRYLLSAAIHPREC